MVTLEELLPRGHLLRRIDRCIALPSSAMRAGICTARTMAARRLIGCGCPGYCSSATCLASVRGQTLLRTAQIDGNAHLCRCQIVARAPLCPFPGNVPAPAATPADRGLTKQEEDRPAAGAITWLFCRCQPVRFGYWAEIEPVSVSFSALSQKSPQPTALKETFSDTTNPSQKPGFVINLSALSGATLIS